MIFYSLVFLIILSKAIKKFKTIYPEITDRFKKEIDKESKFLKKLNHENVIKFFDYILRPVQEVGTLVYVLTEYFQVFFLLNLNNFIIEKTIKLKQKIIRTNPLITLSQRDHAISRPFN